MGPGDESATGSVNFFLERSCPPRLRQNVAMHLPAFSHGVTSFVWALVLAVIIWAGGMSVGMSRATAVVVAAVAGCAIFLFVRIYGEDDPRRP
jgi:ABC-type Na+ efflux pump permease subunit